MTGAVLTPWVLAYAGVSVVTFVVFAVDKARARGGGRRVPEATLHALELFGGWPGSLLAQRLLRHKTRKASYQVVFWAIVVLHLAAWTLYAFR